VKKILIEILKDESYVLNIELPSIPGKYKDLDLKAPKNISELFQ